MVELNKTILGILALGVLVIAAFALVYQSSPTGLVTASSNQPIEKISFAYVPSPISALPIIAFRNGFFAQEGLEVEEIKAPFVAQIFQQVVDNKIDVIASGEIPAVFSALKGGSYQINARLNENTNDLSIISFKEKNINSLADLAGKKVGLVKVSIANYHLWRLLKEKNIDPSLVTVVDVTPQNMASALEHGDVDAIFSWEPVSSKIISGFGSKVSFFNPTQVRWTLFSVVSEKFSKNAEGQKRVLRALLKAEEFIKANPVKAREIIAKETSLDVATLEKVWPVWNFTLTEFTEQPVLSDQSKWAIETNLVNKTSIPDFDSFVDSALVSQVLAERYSGPNAVEKVSLAYVVAPYNAVPIVALRKNFFVEEGLAVEEVRASFVGYVFQGLVDNQIDTLFGAETPGVFVALKGGKYSILAKHEQNSNDLTLISRKDSEIASIKDLVGKKVGLPFTSVSHYHLSRLLKESNIDQSKVIFVDLAPQNMASALDHGDVDAVFVWEPISSKIISGLGPKIDFFIPQTSWMMNVYSSKKFGENKNAQEKLLRALLKADKFIKENPQEAIQIVAKEINLDYATLEKIWSRWDFTLEEFTESQVMQDQAQWVVSAGLVNSTKIPDFQSMVDSQAVRQVLAQRK